MIFHGGSHPFVKFGVSVVLGIILILVGLKLSNEKSSHK
jgi:hypothetical protein